MWGGCCSCRLHRLIILRWELQSVWLLQERLRAWTWALVWCNLSLKALHVLNVSGTACITFVCSVCRSESSRRLKAVIYFSSQTGKWERHTSAHSGCLILSPGVKTHRCVTYISLPDAAVSWSAALYHPRHSDFSINMRLIRTDNRINFTRFHCVL